tara:strand:+ start:1340 stop:2227 length:888 start_codon:yes stop_codon:yes gene_type:complete
MALPNLLIVGAAKSGTTSLHNYLNQHPSVFMCSPKEPHFLINKEIGEQRIPRGVLNIEDYKALFKEASNKMYRGESSVMYLLFPEFAIKNINKYLSKDVKIIVMLRNPVERAYSGYQHVKRYNLMESLSFEKALDQSENRYHNTSNMTPASRYLELGMYFEQVKIFIEEFDNVHVIIYDDYKNDFSSEMDNVFKFLDVDAFKVNTEEKYMVGGWEWKNKRIKSFMMKKSPFKTVLKFLLPFKSLRKIIRKILQKVNRNKIEMMNSDTESWLKEYYKSDVEKLSLLLDKDLNNWTR